MDSSRRRSKPYVFFKIFTLTQIFNYLDIQPTYMCTYSSSLSLVPHSLIHILIQIITHTHVTLEPQASASCGAKASVKEKRIRCVLEFGITKVFWVLEAVIYGINTVFVFYTQTTRGRTRGGETTRGTISQ